MAALPTLPTGDTRLAQDAVAENVNALVDAVQTKYTSLIVRPERLPTLVNLNVIAVSRPCAEPRVIVEPDTAETVTVAPTAAT